ncbi:hypothetical protein [Dinoroseobacter sp. S76]|uniref:hypothetical protein n=1 Tax=Dinoroseobacter sp. S76 TaxID=3415124 RepID=UPI003C7CB307
MKMNIVFASILATIMGLDLAQAASVTLSSSSVFGSQQEQAQDVFADGTPNGQVDSNVGDRNGDQFSTSLTTFQDDGDDLFVATRVFRPETGVTARQTAFGQGEARRTVTVATAGTLRFDMRIAGFYSVASERPDTDPFATFMGDLIVLENGNELASDNFRLSDAAGPDAQTFADLLSVEIDVEAGDELLIYTGVWASSGATTLVSAFMDVQANIDSFFTITTLDGATLGTGPVSPVPLPPSVAMLGLGLAGLAGYRRARRKS